MRIKKKHWWIGSNKGVKRNFGEKNPKIAAQRWEVLQKRTSKHKVETLQAIKKTAVLKEKFMGWKKCFFFQNTDQKSRSQQFKLTKKIHNTTQW